MPNMNVVINSHQVDSSQMNEHDPEKPKFETALESPPPRTIVGGFSSSIYISQDIEDVEIDDFKIEILADAKLIQSQQMKDLKRNFKQKP